MFFVFCLFMTYLFVIHIGFVPFPQVGRRLSVPGKKDRDDDLLGRKELFFTSYQQIIS